MTKKKTSNIIKGWVTSIVGVIVLLMTLLMLFLREINFLWEGIGGLSIGVILLYSPRTIEKLVSKWIGSGNAQPTQQTEDPKPTEPPGD